MGSGGAEGGAIELEAGSSLSTSGVGTGTSTSGNSSEIRLGPASLEELQPQHFVCWGRSVSSTVALRKEASTAIFKAASSDIPARFLGFLGAGRWPVAGEGPGGSSSHVCARG